MQRLYNSSNRTSRVDGKAVIITSDLSEPPNPDDPKDLVYTAISDFADLQRVIYFAKRIKQKKPIWYPGRLLSMPQDLESRLKTDR